MDQPDRKTRSLLRCRPAAKKRGDRILNKHRVLPSPKRKFLSFGRSLRETANDARKGPLSSIPPLESARTRARIDRRSPPEDRVSREPDSVLSVQEFTITTTLVTTSGYPDPLLNFASSHLAFIQTINTNRIDQSNEPVDLSSNLITTAETNSVIIYKYSPIREYTNSSSNLRVTRLGERSRFDQSL